MITTEKMCDRKWVGIVWLWLFCAVVTAAENGSPKTARQWLDAMVEAMQNLDYQATVVYSRENKIQMFRLTHQVRDGVIYENLQSLSNPLRKVIREADKVTCYFPDRRLRIEYQSRSRSLLTSMPSKWEGQEQYYRLELGQKGYMMGRPSQEILIRPLDEYRYGRRIWVDGGSYLPLKFELLDQQGNVLESLAVADLKLGSEERIDPSAYLRHEDWKTIERKEGEPVNRWQLTRLPPGFRELYRSQRTGAGEGETVDHIVISDGLATVSVYIKENDGKAFDSDNLKRGGVSVFSRSIQDHVITVVGDVPMITVRLIGEGIRAEE